MNEDSCRNATTHSTSLWKEMLSVETIQKRNQERKPKGEIQKYHTSMSLCISPNVPNSTVNSAVATLFLTVQPLTLTSSLPLTSANSLILSEPPIPHFHFSDLHHHSQQESRYTYRSLVSISKFSVVSPTFLRRKCCPSLLDFVTQPQLKRPLHSINTSKPQTVLHFCFNCLHPNLY